MANEPLTGLVFPIGDAPWQRMEERINAMPIGRDRSQALVDFNAMLIERRDLLLAARAQAAEAGGLDVERLREALESMVNQFAYWSDGETPGLTTGGLSALEEAFSALGWTDPYPAPWQQCDEPGCRKQSSAGMPTLNGYRRTCHEHMPMEAHEAWQTAWRASGLSYPEFVQQQRRCGHDGFTDMKGKP